MLVFGPHGEGSFFLNFFSFPGELIRISSGSGQLLPRNREPFDFFPFFFFFGSASLRLFSLRSGPIFPQCRGSWQRAGVGFVPRPDRHEPSSPGLYLFLSAGTWPVLPHRKHQQVFSKWPVFSPVPFLVLGSASPLRSHRF